MIPSDLNLPLKARIETVLKLIGYFDLRGVHDPKELEELPRVLRLLEKDGYRLLQGDNAIVTLDERSIRAVSK